MENENFDTTNLPSYDWSEKCILVVDDIEVNYHLINVLLRNTKVKTLWAANGAEAITVFDNNPGINLILMDIRMPVMDGYEATMIIRKTNKKVPIIAQTAYAMYEDATKCIGAGCNDFIEKPILAPVLLPIIDKYITKK